MTSMFQGVHEVRLFRPNGVAVGYFDDWQTALLTIKSEPSDYRACYFTLNPITLPPGIKLNPQALTPSRNTAGDTDIARRVRLLLDFDPPRPANTNSTDAEKEGAREQSEAARDYLRSRNWPEPMLCDSGNGIHLLYGLDLPNDASATVLVYAVLARLKQLFPLVDAGNGNASRLCKLYGSWARKGPHSEERPWRRSAIMDIGSDVIVTEGQLRDLVPPSSPAQVSVLKDSNGKLDQLLAFLDCYDVPIRSEAREVPRGWQVEIECPWSAEHSSEAPRDTVVSFIAERGLGFKCFHGHCAARHWREFRAELERQHPDKTFQFVQDAEPVGEITLGKGAGTVAPEPPQRVKPVYPIEVWEGTAVGEFAKLCAHDNNVPRKMYAESFRCVLGAVVGDRIGCQVVEGALPRSYTVIVAPKGKGKGTAIHRALNFFSHSWNGARKTPGLVIQGDTSGLLSGERDFIWKPKGIGAWMAAASSVPGMARLTKDSDSTIKNKPHLTWGSTLPRILSVHEEMKTFLSTLFIEGGVGSGMEGVICQLWDYVTFHGTATGTREALYGEMMFSMLAAVTEQDWFDILSRGNAVGGGLMSRFNMIGTEGEFENVSRMKPPDFTKLQETFLPRVIRLEDACASIVPSEAAEQIINKWAHNLPEGSERMNIHAWRSALLLSWLKHEDAMSAQTAEDAVRLGQYQVKSHEYYRTKSADNATAKVQSKIIRTLEMKGPMAKRDLQRCTHADRDGTELWNRGLNGLMQDRRVGKREDGAYYLAE